MYIKQLAVVSFWVKKELEMVSSEFLCVLHSVIFEIQIWNLFYRVTERKTLSVTYGIFYNIFSRDCFIQITVLISIYIKKEIQIEVPTLFISSLKV